MTPALAIIAEESIPKLREKYGNSNQDIKKVNLTIVDDETGKKVGMPLTKKLLNKKRQLLRRGTTFQMGNLTAVPGMFMQDVVDDEVFDAWIMKQMRLYLKARLEYGSQLNVYHHIPGFKHIDGKKQIEYKLRKRQNQNTRHGHFRVKELIKKGKLDACLRKPVGNNDSD